MIIDVHVHPFCKEATVLPDREEAFDRQFERLDNEEEKLVAKAMFEAIFSQRSIRDLINEMDAAGVEKACIVAMDLSTHYGVELVTNDDLAEFTAQYPDRFIPFAGVDPSMGRLAVDKLVRAVKNAGCQGLKLVPPVQHFDFSDPKFDPLWQAALDMNVLVWTHCAHQKTHPDSDARLGHPMLVEPVALKYPDLNIVLGHCGFPWPMEAWSLVARHKNVYVDISAFCTLYNHFPWDCYSKYDCEDKVLFASDSPLFGFQDVMEALKQVDISEDFKNKILHHNAARLLGL